jgi:hypothetical protein
MIVIEWNGKRTVLSGWRAWLVGTLVAISVTGFLFVLAFLLLGVAITIGAVLAIAIPVVIVLALLAALFQSPRPR